MAECTVQQIFDDVRTMLGDNQIPGGEIFTNNFLLTGYVTGGTPGSGSLFGEPYRTMFSKLVGASKRVQPNVYVTLPAETTVLIPSTFNIVDFSEPEMIEERQATNAIVITSTDTSTPINVTTTAPHNLGSNGTMAEGAVSGVAGTAAPWGNWFATVTGPSSFTLNGSGSDGLAGTGGAFYPASNVPFTEVVPARLAGTLDGQPYQCLGNYLWSNGRLQFRGSTNNIQLRITYYASGSAPVAPGYTIYIDNCRDFLATATASKAAYAKQWYQIAEMYRNKAYGDPSHPEELSLIDLFYQAQVLASQNMPARQMPFRNHRYRYGTYLLG